MKTLLRAAFFIASGSVAFAAQSSELLHPLFSDHVVLQRDQPINVWGRARAGERVVVTIDRARAEATANASGHWRVALPTMSAGGPYRLGATTAAGESQYVEDVLVGDVWLCSGQSNMALQVHRALDAYTEIANAKNDSIRLLTVPQASSGSPQTQFAAPVEWQLASPQSVPEFSAACFYFARELQRSVNVPMGLISAAWGGSKIESWMSADALRAQKRYDEGLDILSLSMTDPWAALARWGTVWERWWREQASSEPWSSSRSGEWRKAPAPLRAWEEWGNERFANYDGMLWLRTSVELTSAQAAQTATLSLGRVDEVDQTWINGRPIGATASSGHSPEERRPPVIGSGPDRTYRLPRGALVAGNNIIVVNVLDTYGHGGLYGEASSRALHFSDGSSVPLDREWLYQLPPPKVGTPPRAPWEPVAGLSVIYNGMVAPLTPFGIRGVAWYQGESNTNAPREYGELLKGFMLDWRRRFGTELPFLIVQLANYGQPPTQPVASEWAQLREQQRLAVDHDPRAALAVTIDIGNRSDIHPANKQEVGRRLARAARHLVFNESVSASGPRVSQARMHGDRVIVSFVDLTGKLITYSSGSPIGFELCGAEQTSCRFVAATLADNAVTLDASTVAGVTRVRYCWADSPVCTLYDEAQLPAGPFEIEVQP